MGSFSEKKQLRFVITLGTGSFDAAGKYDQITLQGFRASVDIDKAGGVQMGTLRAKIYGVSQSDMNTCTSFTMQAPKDGGYTYQPNTVKVYAIDGTAESLVFAGNIVNAWADYQGMPDVFLNIQAAAVMYGQLKPVPPRSFKGAVDVATVMGQIASDMGFAFENHGVNVKLSDVYLSNTNFEQAKELAHMAGIGLWPDDGVLAITQSPRTPRESKAIPLISPATGMVGYPTYDGCRRQPADALQPGYSIRRPCEGRNGRTASGRGMGCRLCRSSPGKRKARRGLVFHGSPE